MHSSVDFISKTAGESATGAWQVTRVQSQLFEMPAGSKGYKKISKKQKPYFLIPIK